MLRNSNGRVLHNSASTGQPAFRSLSSVAYEAIKKDIVTGLFKPGEALSENRLAKQYAISRTPIREATARLEQENLLRLVPNKGYFVTFPSVNELNALYQYRAIMESACAEIASQTDVPRDLIPELRRVASVQYKRGDRPSYVRFIVADTAFHIGIARATGNDFLIRAVTELRSQIERLLYATINVEDYGSLLAREHRDILNAVVHHKPDVAKRLMLQHVVGSKDKVFQLM